jgi:hypothetical protein
MLGCTGAREVRYVYQDGHSGVIGMPENTSRWPTYYRKHADALMQKHFPDGYEVVRAEEVVEGSRTLTINGSTAAEIQPGSSSHIFAVGKLGRTTSRSQADSLKIKECRILYRKAEPLDPQAQREYAERALWTPAPYLDPNALDRKLARAKGSEGKSDEPVALAKATAVATPEKSTEAKPGSAAAGNSGAEPPLKTDHAVLEAARDSKPRAVSP